MSTVWAQRREELLSDCIVSPEVFNQMVDRLAPIWSAVRHQSVSGCPYSLGTYDFVDDIEKSRQQLGM